MRISHVLFATILAGGIDMAAQLPRRWRYVRNYAAILGIVVLSVLTTLLVQRFITPPLATAQTGQLQEVRASKFTLVGPDGTVLATLQPGVRDGNGQLNVFDGTTGKARVRLSGAGAIVALDPDGTTPRLVAGYTSVPGPTGNPPFNGIQLDPQGAITILPPPP